MRRYLSVCALRGSFDCFWQGLPEEVEKELKQAKKQKISVTKEESTVLEMLDKADWKFVHKALTSNGNAEYIFVNSA